MARVRRKRKAGEQEDPRTSSRAPLLAGLLLLFVMGIGLVAYIGQDSGGDVSGGSFQGDGQGRVLGDTGAPLLIRDFSDFKCPHCKAAAASLTPNIIETYIETGKVRLEFVPVAVLGKDSAAGAQAALCAEEQDAFWSYHDILFEHQQETWKLETLIAYAAEADLDTNRFRDCLSNQTYWRQIEKNNRDLTRASEENGYSVATPTFLVGDEVIQGNVDFQILRDVIESKVN